MEHQNSSGDQASRRGGKKRLLAIPLMVLAMVAAVVASWAGPVVAADNRALVSDALDGAPIGTCIVTATSDGFRVDWAPSANEGDYVIIERRIFNSFHWRGRQVSSTGSFSDGLAPQKASKIEYRIFHVGQFTREVTCDIASTPGMSCSQTLVGSEYLLDWSGEIGSGIDYVVKRRFPTTEEPVWPSPITRNWRAETNETSFSDSVSPKGLAQYQVIARSDRIIVGSTFCEDPAQECASWRLLPAGTALPDDLKPTKNFISEVTPQGRVYGYLVFKNETSIRVADGTGVSEEILSDLDNTRFPSFFATSGERLFVRLGTTAETFVYDPACLASANFAQILSTIASIETGGDYLAEPDAYNQSGAYAISDTIWDDYSQFTHAYHAPEATQDAKAVDLVAQILDSSDRDISAIPVAWLLGEVPELGDPAWDNPAPTKPGTTPREYQAEWLDLYSQLIPVAPPAPLRDGGGEAWDPDGLPQDAPRPVVSGAQLWVSPTGNDGNPGTEQAPLRNLQAAVNQASPGTTIQVQTGTYNRVTIAKSGRADAWIVLTAAPGANPKIVANQGEGIRLRGAYLAVNGFTIEGVGGSDDIGGSGYGYGILATNYKTGAPRTDVHHIYLTDNEVYGWSTGGISSGWANWLVVAGNDVHDNSNWGREGGSGISFLESTNAGGPPGPAGYTQWVIGNTVTNNRQLVPSTLIGSNEKLDGNGIILDRLDVGGFANRTLIAHNFVANNGGRGSHAYKSSNVDMINNTLYQNGEYVNGELSAYNSNNVIFTKNLVIPRPGRSAYFGEGIDAGDNTLLDSDTDPNTLADTAQATGTGVQGIDLRIGLAADVNAPGG